MSPKDEQRTKVTPWTCPNDGMVHPWVFQGNYNLYRNYENEIFSGTRDNLVWMGIYLPRENRIDTTVPEPTWDDEDDADVTIVSGGPVTLNGVTYAPGTFEIRIIEVEEDEDE